MSNPYKGESVFKGIQNSATLAASNVAILETLPELIRGQAMYSKLIRAKYLSLISEGFTEAQALELCK